MIQISYQIQKIREVNFKLKECQKDCVRLLKNCLNIFVLGIFAFYCTTLLYCCDSVRVISLHRLDLFLIRGVKIQYKGQNHKNNQ